MTTDANTPTTTTRRPAAGDYDLTATGRVGRRAVTGAAVGSPLLGLVVGGASLIASGSSGQALGLGAAVALTGGPFFGALVGFASAVRAEELASRDRPRAATVADPATQPSVP